MDPQCKNMKTALLVFGLPRFCQEFNTQLDKLQNSEIEWIVAIWKNYPPEVMFGENLWRNKLNTPTWENTVTDNDSAREYLEARMPEGHVLRHVELVDWNDFPNIMISDYPNRISCEPKNFFRQHWMLKICDMIRQMYGPYDLVMRSRGDTGIARPVLLDQIHQQLINDPKRIVIASNHRQCDFNDLFTIGLPDTMSTYCNVVEEVNHYNLDLGVPLNPELMVTTILKSHGIHWGDDGYLATIRTMGQHLDNNGFVPDFGIWN